LLGWPFFLTFQAVEIAKIQLEIAKVAGKYSRTSEESKELLGVCLSMKKLDSIFSFHVSYLHTGIGQ